MIQPFRIVHIRAYPYRGKEYQDEETSTLSSKPKTSPHINEQQTTFTVLQYNLLPRLKIKIIKITQSHDERRAENLAQGTTPINTKRKKERRK